MEVEYFLIIVLFQCIKSMYLLIPQVFGYHRLLPLSLRISSHFGVSRNTKYLTSVY